MFNSVSGTSNSSSTAISKGMGGLVSGMNTDELVENMSAGTSNKIDQKTIERQKITWKKEAYRTLTGALTEFNNKYFSYSSSTNITSASFFEAYKVNNLSDKVGLSGKMDVANNVILDKITQLATKSKYSYTADMSSKLTADFDASDKDVSVLDGQKLSLKYGDMDVNLRFSESFGKELKEAIAAGKTEDEAMQDTLQTMVKNAGLVNSKGEALVKVAVKDGKVSFTGHEGSRELSLNGGKEQMAVLGFDGTGKSGKGTLEADKDMGTLSEKKDIAQQLTGKKITFYLDGTKKSVTLGDYTGDAFKTDGKMDATKVKDGMLKDLNAGLEKEFGSRDTKTRATFTPAGGTAMDLSTYTDDAGNSQLVYEKEAGKYQVVTATKQADGSISYAEDLTKPLIELADEAGKKKLKAKMTQEPAVKAVFSGANSDKISFELFDKSSTFAIDSADAGLLGKENGIFKFAPGTVNKLNVNMTLKDFGLDFGTPVGHNQLTIDVKNLGAGKSMTIVGADGKDIDIPLDTPENIAKALKTHGYTVSQQTNNTTGVSKLIITGSDPEKSMIKGVKGLSEQDQTDGKYKLEDGIFQMGINGETITVKESDSLSKMMTKVNQSNAGVTMNYSAMTGTFVLESKNYGATTGIKLGMIAKDAEGNPIKDAQGNVTYKAPTGLEKALFGTDKASTDKGAPIVVQGVNAKVTMTVNGEQMDVERASNTISIDGLNIELKATTAADDKPISFDVVNDTDKVMENVKGFVADYNALLKIINTETATKPDTDYAPLTDKQKEGMTQDQIKQWETEAKKGILFNDTTLNSITQSMRSALFANVSGVKASMNSVGLSTGDWSKKGQLVLDEAKMRKVLNDDPATVAHLFTQQSEVDYSPTLTAAEKQQRYKESGMMNRFQDILKSAVGTTTPKGTLLQIAGMENDRTDDDNQLKDKVDDIDASIKKLKRQLATERERYWKQFTAMEKYLNQMNQQSSTLTQQFGM